MSRYQDLISLVEQGQSRQSIAQAYPWGSLSAEDREQLLQEAKKRAHASPSSTKLVVTLVELTHQKEPWDFLRALALYVSCEGVTTKQKQQALVQMDQTLEKLSTSLDGLDSDIKRFKHYKADYHALRARIHLEDNDVHNARQQYSRAIEIYQEYGFSGKAAAIRKHLDDLQAIASQRQQLLPLDDLTARRVTLQGECNQLWGQIEQRRQILGDLHQAETTKAELDQELTEKQRQLEDMKQEISVKKVERLAVDEEVQRSQAGLNFLLSLPRAATAPLWVEVVRLALQQGEIDDLTRQALERLAIECPQEALPLLAEVAARAPEPIRVPDALLAVRLDHWMVSMAQAKQLVTSEPLQAAEELVGAWESFFATGETK